MKQIKQLITQTNLYKSHVSFNKTVSEMFYTFSVISNDFISANTHQPRVLAPVCKANFITTTNTW